MVLKVERHKHSILVLEEAEAELEVGGSWQLRDAILEVHCQRLVHGSYGETVVGTVPAVVVEVVDTVVRGGG